MVGFGAIRLPSIKITIPFFKYKVFANFHPLELHYGFLRVSYIDYKKSDRR